MNYQQKGYAVCPKSGEIEAMTYAEYLREHYSNEALTDLGKRPTFDVFTCHEYEGEAPRVFFEVRRWNGTKWVKWEEYETEDEAWQMVFGRWEMNHNEASDNAPTWWWNEGEARKYAFNVKCVARNMPRDVNMHKLIQTT